VIGMSTIEMIFLILMIMLFACEILSFMVLITLSTEIDKITLHMDFIKHDLQELREKDG
jgi:hypothetical protein